MKRSLLAVPVLVLALAGCSDNQSGDANTDSQVVQPPAASSTSVRTQGPDPSAGPQASSTDPAQQTGENGATTG